MFHRVTRLVIIGIGLGKITRIDHGEGLAFHHTVTQPDRKRDHLACDRRQYINRPRGVSLHRRGQDERVGAVFHGHLLDGSCVRRTEPGGMIFCPLDV